MREQLDWTEIREATQDNPFAEAFLLLIERLGILTPFDADSDSSATQRSSSTFRRGGEWVEEMQPEVSQSGCAG